MVTRVRLLVHFGDNQRFDNRQTSEVNRIFHQKNKNPTQYKLLCKCHLLTLFIRCQVIQTDKIKFLIDGGIRFFRIWFLLFSFRWYHSSPSIVNYFFKKITGHRTIFKETKTLSVLI